MSDAQTDLRYPVGKFNRPDRCVQPPSERRELVDQIAATPARMREAVAGLNESQLDTPYRDGGWTVRQVVHHVPDSHMNAYTRVKLALTEEQPTIKPYDEAAWAKLNDVRDTPIETSLVLLETLHQRFDTILRAMTRRRFRTHAAASRHGRDDARRAHRHVRVARPPSRRRTSRRCARAAGGDSFGDVVQRSGRETAEFFRLLLRLPRLLRYTAPSAMITSRTSPPASPAPPHVP